MTLDRVWIRLRRPFAVWFGLAIALVMAMAPTVSHAVAWSQGASGLEICTATGPLVVPADATASYTDSPSGQESALSLAHCQFCLHAVDRCTPPPSPLHYFFQAQGGQQKSAAWQTISSFTRFACAPPSRGPPDSL